MESATEQKVVQPELYCRVNITQNTKGRNAETTVSVRGEIDRERLMAELVTLLVSADWAARDEISRREALDLEEGGAS